MSNYFSKNLKYLRKSKKLTLEEFSETLEVKRSTLSNYEKDLTIASISVLEKVCTYFKVTPTDILEVDLSNEPSINNESVKSNNTDLDQSSLLQSKNDTISALNGQIDSLKSQIALYEKLLKEKEG